ncbi:uncharacterized protein LOC134783347 [Penaeus indicus]|uniref:uncharacterized protein LOC134783347 n=1 Tax=Penaeus indicus TaxID=29960 RepID=UPI00300D9E98
MPFQRPAKSELELSEEKLATLREDWKDLRQATIRRCRAWVDALQIAQEAYNDLLSLLKQLTLTSCSDADEEITGDASDLLTYILDSMEALAIELQNDPSLTSRMECLANQLIALSADLRSGDLEPPSNVDALLNRTQDLQEELADSLSEARSDLQEVVSALEAKEGRGGGAGGGDRVVARWKSS